LKANRAEPVAAYFLSAGKQKNHHHVHLGNQVHCRVTNHENCHRSVPHHTKSPSCQRDGQYMLPKELETRGFPERAQKWWRLKHCRRRLTPNGEHCTCSLYRQYSDPTHMVLIWNISVANQHERSCTIPQGAHSLYTPCTFGVRKKMSRNSDYGNELLVVWQ